MFLRQKRQHRRYHLPQNIHLTKSIITSPLLRLLVVAATLMILSSSPSLLHGSRVFKSISITTTSARAFSTVSRISPLRGPLSPPSSSSIATLRLSGSTGEEEYTNGVNGNTNDADRQRKAAATGWNHNKPSDSSRFWKSPNGDSSSARQRAGYNSSDNNSSSGENNKEPRTGWLHNTEAPTTKGKDFSKSGQGISKAQQRLKSAMKLQQENHRIISPAAFHACGGDRQIVVTEHRISVPLVYNNKNVGGSAVTTTDVAFTIVEEVKDEATRKWFQALQFMSPNQRAVAYVEKADMTDANSMCLYLQGGPGFGSPTPVVGLSFGQDASWGSAALTKYKRIVLMDQRGTGQSAPITKQSLEKKFPDLFLLDGKQEGNDGTDELLDRLATSYPDEYSRFQTALNDATYYMSQFRADNIVRDAETIREALLKPFETVEEAAATPRPWGCSLGQSFGGFCTMTYLSLVDHPPQICLFTGGIAPFGKSAVDVYTSLWDKVKRRNLQYYTMYPGDIPVVKKIVQKLLVEPQPLPSGGVLTARRFLQLGMMMGGGPSNFANLHSILSTAFLQPDESEFTRAFLKYMDNAEPFDEHPIYFWLHESIYADGSRFSPTNWSANQAYEAKISTPSEYDYRLTSALASDDRLTLFFGEMVFPWMAEDYVECAGIGCTLLANNLASKDDWGRLYDADQMRMVLGDGRTRSAAAVYYDDIYVDFDMCMQVTSPGGPLEKTKVYITNEYQHSGLRDAGSGLFTKLHGMATGSVRTPS
jgi:pimeloyl-ACP methyl ester carboxylesterase